MTEEEASADLHARGVFRMAPGLRCDKSVPDLIAVHPDADNAIDVRRALKKAGMLPPKRKRP